MSKRKAAAPAACGCLGAEQPAPPLKMQSRWSGIPWQPGEIPAGSFMPVSRPHNETAPVYGQPRFGVEKPANRGGKWPGKED